MKNISFLFLMLLVMSGAALTFSAINLAAPGKYSGHVVSPHHGHHPVETLDVLYSSNTSVPIHDLDTVYSTLNVDSSGNFIITSLNVLVNIQHTWIRDLQISLLPPNDDTLGILLLTDFPWDSAVNMTNCWFDDGACTLIGEDSLTTGTFRPDSALSHLIGRNANGLWTLRVIDRYPADSGQIQNWALDINPTYVLHGTVRNRATQTPISEAKIEIIENGFCGRSKANGTYGFASIPPDTYTVRFTAANYDTLVVPDVILAEGESRTLDAGLFSPHVLADFTSTSAPVHIGDGDSVTMTLNIDANVRITDLDVTVNIHHTSIGDLSVWMIGPGNHIVQLVDSGAARFSQQNMIHCRFDDEAATPFTSGQAPFTGSWRPYRPLSGFDTLSVNGIWSLSVADFFEGDTGRIDSFTVHLTGTLNESIHKQQIPVSDQLALYGNYPNPFNSSTNLRFHLPHSTDVQLEVFNLLGERVAALIHEPMEAGLHTVLFDASSLPSGLYFARLSALQKSDVHKLVLLR